MRVKLLQCTQNPIDVMWTAARTCYASESPIDMWDSIYDYSKYFMQTENIINVKIDKDAANELENEKNKRWKLVQQVLNSGHQSIAEHVYFTFAIEGITRACSHQIVRHRHCTFSQQSQRYVEIKVENDGEVDLSGTYIVEEAGIDSKTHNYISSLYQLYKGPINQEQKEQAFNKIKQIVDKYFVTTEKTSDDDYEFFYNILNKYTYEITYGHMKPEDARQFLPNATKTNITTSFNYRELIHMCNLRLCTRAQLEIRNLFKAIKEEVKQVDERLAKYLVPQCEIYGFCMEKQSCGRYPKLDDIKTKRWIPNYGKAEK